MSRVLESKLSALPILSGDPRRAFASFQDRIIARAEFERHVTQVYAQLPPSGSMIDLCEQRYWFLVAYTAALLARHCVLLPSSRTEQIVREVQTAHPGSYVWDDQRVAAAIGSTHEAAKAHDFDVPPEHVAMIGMTSGSTGKPQQHPKAWYSVSATTALNEQSLRKALQVDAHCVPWVVATVPPQHMFGMELSVLLPLLGNVAVHGGRPLFPADVATALAAVPGPRVLVTTPVHLRALVQSGVVFPTIDLVVCATAPLDAGLAREVERRLQTQLLEVFGSTETCIFAQRRTARETVWQLHPQVELLCEPTLTRVSAPWLQVPVALQDVMERVGDRGFIVHGRNADMIEVAGKRASLADLTRRLLAIEGVVDGVMFQADLPGGAVRRMTALAVAPDKTSRQLLDELRTMIDPAFMPRPLICVERLPRDATGKLPRAALLELLQRQRSSKD